MLAKNLKEIIERSIPITAIIPIEAIGIVVGKGFGSGVGVEIKVCRF